MWAIFSHYKNLDSFFKYFPLISSSSCKMVGGSFVQKMNPIYSLLMFLHFIGFRFRTFSYILFNIHAIKGRRSGRAVQSTGLNAVLDGALKEYDNVSMKKITNYWLLMNVTEVLFKNLSYALNKQRRRWCNCELEQESLL